MYFNGEETSHYNQNDMDLFRKNNVGFIFQNYNIIDSYTVLENVMLPLKLNGYSKYDI
jgi:putative ABC transport system ATP-binding protein